MFIHHLTTILLIIFSYTCNLIRGGSLVLIIHDFSDVFMEAAKMFKYIKWQRGCDFCFGLFFFVWTITRLIIFPGYLIKKQATQIVCIVSKFACCCYFYLCCILKTKKFLINFFQFLADGSKFYAHVSCLQWIEILDCSFVFTSHHVDLFHLENIATCIIIGKGQYL